MSFSLMHVTFRLRGVEYQSSRLECLRVIAEGESSHTLTQPSFCSPKGVSLHRMEPGAEAYNVPDGGVACPSHFSLAFPTREGLEREYGDESSVIIYPVPSLTKGASAE